jgi:hypothetical protein
MNAKTALSIVAVVYAKRDLKQSPYSQRLAQIFEEVARRLGSGTYEGDIYLGETAPKYKKRGRRYKLPKNVEQLKDEIANGRLWNFVLYDRDDFDAFSIYAKMQPDAVLGAPASIYITVPIDRASANEQVVNNLWLHLFEAVDEYGWGFVDVTDNLKDYLFKLDGILYGHFPEAWKKELDIWKNNRSKVEEGILDVYCKNLWSPVHIEKMGGQDRLRGLLGADFFFESLPRGGARVDLAPGLGECASESLKEKRVRLRWTANPLLWRS